MRFAHPENSKRRTRATRRCAKGSCRRTRRTDREILSAMIQLEPSGRIGADFPVSLLATTKLVGAVGIEPTTFGLKGRCSTTELRPCGDKRQLYRKIGNHAEHGRAAICGAHCDWRPRSGPSIIAGTICFVRSGALFTPPGAWASIRARGAGATGAFSPGFQFR